LLLYAATSKAPVFHILWNNKLEFVDRTFLLLYYRLFGKAIVYTVHNVNIRKRDGKDSFLNRLTLRAQYHLVDHLFVHTTKMSQELHDEFGVSLDKISVIPFGINSTVPNTAMTPPESRQRLGLSPSDKVILFFGNIAPYKGLNYLVDAVALLARRMPQCRLIIAGRIKGSESHWAEITAQIATHGLRSIILGRIEFIPDAETETYFKAADVLVLPYTHVFQSGVLFLGYNFGLPVIAADVGTLKEDIFEGETGFVCRPKDAVSLAATLERYFESELYRTLESRRREIHRFAAERYSWTKVATITKDVYMTVTASRRRQI
jgi:glycosyltransferase involved in cell wall biosynthesis